MGSPPRDSDFLNCSATTRAGLALLPKYVGKVYVAATLALGIYIVSIGAATLFDSQVQNTP